MNGHPSVRMTTPDGRKVKIDCEIAELIRSLWDMGLETCNSCQDNFGYVWVEFASADDASAFLSAISRYGDHDLRWRSENTYDVDPKDRRRLVDDYKTWDDCWLIAAHGDAYHRVVSITISIRFPREHLARVFSALTCVAAVPAVTAA